MVFEPNFKKVVSSTRKNIGITQVAVEVKLPTQEPNIDAIYSVGAKSTILSCETLGNTINFTGLVDFQAIYKSDLKVAGVDYSAEFKGNFIASEEVLGDVVINSNVVDVNSQVTASGINVVAIVEVVIDEIVSKDINVLVSVGGDGVHQNFKNIEFSSYLGKAYEKFDVTHDLSIAGAREVLMVTPCVSLLKVEPKDNYLVLQGVLGLDVCYTKGENLNDIANEYHSVDFTWEVALNGIMLDSVVQSNIMVVSNEIKVSSSIDEAGVSVNLYVPIVYNGYIFNKEVLDVVSDVYLEEYYLSVTTESFESILNGKALSFSDNISGTASILDTAPFIDDIVGVTTNNLVLARSVVEDGKLIIEGVASAVVVYYTKETSDLTSIQVEMPFAVEQKVDLDNSSVVTICLNKINARSKRGKEIEVSAVLDVYSDLYALDNINIISDIALSNSKPQDDCALIIYIVKPNQTLWDIAKEIGVSQELILEQNSDIELPVKAGDKLVVYKPRILNF